MRIPPHKHSHAFKPQLQITYLIFHTPEKDFCVCTKMARTTNKTPKAASAVSLFTEWKRQPSEEVQCCHASPLTPQGYIAPADTLLFMLYRQLAPTKQQHRKHQGWHKRGVRQMGGLERLVGEQQDFYESKRAFREESISDSEDSDSD